MSTKKEPQLVFSEVWERLIQATEIKNQTQLAELAGITSQAVSKKKKQNEFPVHWAYLAAERYNLSLDWLMKGRGKPLLCELPENSEKIEGMQVGGLMIRNNTLIRLEEWLEEAIANDPRNETWFELQLEKSFPEYKEWTQRKNAANQRRRVTEGVT